MVRLLMALASIALVALLLVGCSAGTPDEAPLVVGYLGGLSGRASSLGIPARDGALLAVEQANERGGVAGRQVVLEVADDGNGNAADGFRELARKGAVAVVGPVVSDSAVEAVIAANELHIPLVSPTVSTGDLTGLDDYFLRVYPDNVWAGKRLADIVVGDRGYLRIAVAYDLSNRAYTETQFLSFKRSAEPLGASVVTTATFTSGKNPDYTDLAERLISGKPDCILLVANAIDTAMLCQRIRAVGSSVPIVATPWSATPDLITSGGSAVEGLMYLDTLDRTKPSELLGSVTTAFEKRFGYDPGFPALHAYEAMSFVLEVAESDPTPAAIKSGLTSGDAFRGLQGPVKLNRYGDATRAYQTMTVDSGQFRPVGP